MAKYDHGGGCACGLRAECDCGAYKTSSYTVNQKPVVASKPKLAPMLYTTEEGGEFRGMLVHSVFLPDGSIWDATLGGWRE